MHPGFWVRGAREGGWQGSNVAILHFLALCWRGGKEGKEGEGREGRSTGLSI